MVFKRFQDKDTPKLCAFGRRQHSLSLKEAHIDVWAERAVSKCASAGVTIVLLIDINTILISQVTSRH